MLGIVTMAVGLCVSAGKSEPSQSAPIVSPGEFQSWFDSARAGRLDIPRPVERQARGYRYVFIGGFRGERIVGYFRQNIQQLRGRGVPKHAIHRVDPDSGTTVAAHAPVFRDRILEIAAKGPEPLVLIAHSRGACDTLAFLLADPEFARDRVKAAFLLQGPFGGSALADLLAGDGPPIDGRMSWGQRTLARIFARVESLLLARGWHAGLPGLSRESSSAFWASRLARHAESVPLVGSKVFYITTATTTRLGLFGWVTESYLGLHFGPNDGLVALEDQSLAGVGTVLAVLDVAHADLTRRFPAARAEPRLRRALVDAILMSVGHSDRAPNASTSH